MLIGSLPDPASPGVLAVTSIVTGFLGTTYGLLRGLPRDDVQWTGFAWAYLGVGLGLLIYFVSMIVEL